MDISSTPFIRNDYFPDYNELNELNQRINEVENELSLTNISLIANIENVSNNLNNYIASQADTITTNNIIVNNINANYAMGDYSNFKNANFDNTYIENLTVNKPIFDVTLNTPHIENVTSLGGNIFHPNIIDAHIYGNVDGTFINLNANNVEADNATINNLFVNINETPVSSSAVLGYDENGRVIPIHATYDVSFPESADYLYTDSQGIARKGTASTEVDTSLNLITSLAVKNAVDSVTGEMTNNFDIIYNSLNDIDDWENTFENSVGNTFNDVFNNFNNINNIFNDVNNEMNNGFNDTNQTISDLTNTINNLMFYINSESNYYKAYFTSGRPIAYIDYSNILFGEPPIEERSNYNVIAVDKYKMGYKNIYYNNTNHTVYIPNVSDIALSVFNSIFYECSNFNQPVTIPYGVTSCYSMFENCRNFNQPIIIPNSVTSCYSMFFWCHNFNQPVEIPNSVTDCRLMFNECNIFNQPITIPNSVTNCDGMFYFCYNFNQQVEISNSVTDCKQMFLFCQKFNQPIIIPNSVTDCKQMFFWCHNFNQPIINIYSDKITSMGDMFSETQLSSSTKIHINSSIPKDTSNYIYNCLVNGNAGITFTAENIFNDL